MCAYRCECRRCCVIYKVTCKWCGGFYVGNTQNTLKIMEEHFQDVAQKVINNNSSDSFAAHFAKHFTQKPSPHQYYELIPFDILAMVNHIGSMKTWGKSPCILCMK